MISQRKAIFWISEGAYHRFVDTDGSRGQALGPKQEAEEESKLERRRVVGRNAVRS